MAVQRRLHTLEPHAARPQPAAPHLQLPPQLLVPLLLCLPEHQPHVCPQRRLQLLNSGPLALLLQLPAAAADGGAQGLVGLEELARHAVELVVELSAADERQHAAGHGALPPGPLLQQQHRLLHSSMGVGVGGVRGR
jgi:hypothetical protein